MMAHIRGTKQSRRAARALPVIAAGIILAHSFYSIACCAGKDCHPVPCDEIIKIADGWVYHTIEFGVFK